MRRSPVSNIISLVLSIAFLQSCAYVTAIPVDYRSKTSGIRIYDVKPLLVVTGRQVDVILVPNYNKAYALQFGSFLAKHDFSARFEKGFIAEIESKQDTSELAIELVKLVQEAVKSGNPISDAFAGKIDGGMGGRLQVYDIVFDTQGNLAGLRPLISEASLVSVPVDFTLPGTGVTKSNGATPTPAPPAGSATKVDVK